MHSDSPDFRVSVETHVFQFQELGHEVIVANVRDLHLA